jgi:hypothetical protein
LGRRERGVLEGVGGGSGVVVGWVWEVKGVLVVSGRDAEGVEVELEGGDAEFELGGGELEIGAEDDEAIGLGGLDGKVLAVVLAPSAVLELGFPSGVPPSPSSPRSIPAARQAARTSRIALELSFAAQPELRHASAAESTVPPVQWHRKSVSLAHPSFVNDVMKHVRAHCGRSRDSKEDCRIKAAADVGCGIEELGRIATSSRKHVNGGDVERWRRKCMFEEAARVRSSKS